MTRAADWPLTGVRVVDLSADIAGPYCTKLLVDAGAEVIKIEPPGGDPLRRFSASGTAIPAGKDGALFQYLNASKHSVVADLDTKEGRERVLDLSATADVVVESLGAGEMASRGLSFDVLQQRNPRLALVSISPWGQTGPWAHRPATEWTLQAATGSTASRGLPERGPVGLGGRIGDWIAGSYAAVGAVIAWISARQTGSGQHVDLSTFEAMLTVMPCFGDLHGQLLGGAALMQRIELPGVEPAKDGWVGFCTTTGQQWKDVCGLIGRPELGEDPLFQDFSYRMTHVNVLCEAFHAYTRQHTVDEIVETATAWRIPCSPVGNGRDVVGMDHMVERGVFIENPGGFLQPRTPFQMERTPPRPIGPAPKLGEHGDDTPPKRQRPTGTTGAETPVSLPLAGLRVVDLTAFWAGPAATLLLADMGADVVKVESIQRPDGMRFATAIRTDPLWEHSAVFHGNNAGKRGITLHLASAEGRALFTQLLMTADVVAENFSARVMEHFGLGWDAIHAINPRLIMLRMPAYGLDGPWRDRPGFAANVEQACGLAWITGYADMPLIMNVCDVVGGMHGVFALLMALEHRRQTGEGQLVEATLLEPALNVAAEQVIEYSAYGTLLSRMGNRSPYAAPQGVYACADPDERLALAIANDAQWQALCSVIGATDWVASPELGTLAGRRAAHDAIDARLNAWLAGRTREGAVDMLVAAGVPAHALINGYHIMPNPQLEHREFFQVLDHPIVGRIRYPGLPMRFSGFPRHLHRWAPPLLGQHNDAVLGGELGLSPEKLAALREKQVIGERPTFM
ncbi:MAG: CoA transferase [Candidatus Binatia bacterium]